MSNNNRGVFISDIPFFDDYILWIRCKREAKKKDIKLRYFIIRCVQDYLTSVNDKLTINTTERFYDACELKAREEGVTVANIIEKACAATIGVPVISTIATPQQQQKNKGSIFDLNRDLR